MIEVFPLLKRHLFRKGRIYDFRHYREGVEYVLEMAKCHSRAYVTCHGRVLNVGDYIQFRHESPLDLYQVEAIQVYSSPADMWMAQLVKVH